MTIFAVGLAMFVVGAVLNGVGWSMHRKSIKAAAPEGFWAWFLEQLRHWYPLLTGPDATVGQRVAAFGALLAGLGIVAMVIGLVSAAG
jgi:hypothetical protein